MNLPRSAPLSWAVISLATCLLAPPAPAEQGVGGGYWREATPATAAPPAVEEGEDLKVLQLAAAEEPLPGRAPPARGGPGAVEPADEAGAAALEEGDDELPAAGPEEEALEELDGGLGTPPPAAGEEGAEPPAPETSPAPAAPAEAPAGGEAAPAETDEAPPAGEVAPAETDEEAARQRFLPQSPAFQGKRVDIMDGEIPVSEFISFLADYTGLPVLVDAQPNTLSNPITIAAPIRDADGEMVKAILQVNRWLVRQETLPNGKDVLVVESLQTSIPGAEEPKPSRLLKVVENRATEVPGTIRSEIEGVPDDEIVTMLFTLKYRVPTDAISALNSLISSGATAAPRPGVPGARGRAFSAVEIPDTMMMIVTAKFSLIDYIQKLLAIIDVEIDRPERIVHIIEVEEAEVMELVSLIESFLQQSATSMRRGTTATSRIRRTTTAAPRPTGTPGTPTPPGTVDRDEYPTTLIPDQRTQKIIVQTYSVQDLEDINMLVRELDARWDIRRLRTRIYRMRFLSAVDVAPVITQVLGIGGGYSGRSGTSGLGSRTSRTTGQTPTAAQATPRPTGITTAPGAQGGVMTSLVVPHEETNSLIIQAEPEEYEEIMNILGKIDVKRRQVFLEAALVQVSTQSALNYTIELLAGEPDDHDTRVLVETSFGLSGIDTESFTRILPDLSTAPSGMLAAIQHRGKFPALVSFFKGNQDSEVVATPFILADDNEQNTIQITETRFVINTNTVNQATTTSQQGEDAGITLDIFPTINSANNVRLEVSLEVSEFGQAGTAELLPPKTTNSVMSAVSISDDRIYVIGGLTRQNKGKSVSKIPILGDIPLVGKLFRSESTSKAVTNLYVFLRAHILTTGEGLATLSDKAQDSLEEKNPHLQLTEFEGVDIQEEEYEEDVDPDAPREFPRRVQTQSPVQSLPGRYRGDPESPFGTPRQDDEADLPVFSPETDIIREIDTTTRPSTSGADRLLEDMRREEPPPARPAETAPDGAPIWQKRGLELDEGRDSWFLPVKMKETARERKLRSRLPQEERKPDAVKTGWLEG